MKTAKIRVVTIEIECPNCGEAMEHPHNGSQSYSAYSVLPEKVVCHACGCEAKTPSKTKATTLIVAN